MTETGNRLSLALISAWNDSGGGFTHRLLDGHPDAAVWPFELQLGTTFRHDGYEGAFHAKYRWPNFPAPLPSASAIFDSIIDDELKSILINPSAAKHQGWPVKVDLDSWRRAFSERMRDQPGTRAAIVQAYLQSFFTLWQPGARLASKRWIVGHCPSLILDGDEIFADFPDAKVLHVVRDPLAGWADFSRRRPEVSAARYASRWNVVNSVAVHAARKYQNVKLIPFQRLLTDRKQAVLDILQHLGLPFYPIVLEATWNGTRIPEGDMGPFGGVPTVSVEHERRAVASVSAEDREILQTLTAGTRMLLDEVAPGDALSLAL